MDISTLLTTVSFIQEADNREQKIRKERQRRIRNREARVLSRLEEGSLCNTPVASAIASGRTLGEKYRAAVNNPIGYNLTLYSDLPVNEKKNLTLFSGHPSKIVSRDVENINPDLTMYPRPGLLPGNSNINQLEQHALQVADNAFTRVSNNNNSGPDLTMYPRSGLLPGKPNGIPLKQYPKNAPQVEGITFTPIAKGNDSGPDLTMYPRSGLLPGNSNMNQFKQHALQVADKAFTRVSNNNNSGPDLTMYPRSGLLPGKPNAFPLKQYPEIAPKVADVAFTSYLKGSDSGPDLTMYPRSGFKHNLPDTSQEVDFVDAPHIGDSGDSSLTVTCPKCKHPFHPLESDERILNPHCTFRNTFIMADAIRGPVGTTDLNGSMNLTAVALPFLRDAKEAFYCPQSRPLARSSPLPWMKREYDSFPFNCSDENNDVSFQYV